METFIKIVLSSIVAVAILVGMVTIFLNKSEQEECYKLQAQSQEGYEGFYITNWQSKMCKAQSIIIEAEVR